MNFNALLSDVSGLRNLLCSDDGLCGLPKFDKQGKVTTSSARVLTHDYHDHADVTVVSERRCAKGGVVTPFPLKLHQVLNRIEEDGHGDIISWQPHGRSFVVRKPAEFKHLLPKYFGISKMASFQRQINLYGFSRLTQGPDKSGYYHELFLRGKPELALKMRRIRVKGTGVRQRPNPTAEPDFWNMPWVGKNGRSIRTTPNSDNLLSAFSESHLQQTRNNVITPPITSSGPIHFMNLPSLSHNETLFPVSDDDTESVLSELPLDGLFEHSDDFTANLSYFA